MIKNKLLSALLLLAISASPALAEMKFAIGEPIAESTKSGIGQISGWAVSDDEIVSVEALIDGVSLGLVPYGGTRQDVATAFPDFPNSEFSGWSMKWNYSLLTPGEHILTIIITDVLGAQQSKDVVFSTTAFKTAFIGDPDGVSIEGATITTLEDGRILITGAVVDGETVDIELQWDTGSQQFQISEIFREEPQNQNQSPTANAGPSLNVKVGEKAVVEGEAHDPDGTIASYSWSQVSGIAVDLVNADTPMVEFIAPDETGTIRLRLEVMDDSGDHGSDETVVVVELPEPGAENKPPTADAGPNRTMLINESIQIEGFGYDSDGGITQWQWEQISGVSLTLHGANSGTVQVQSSTETGEATLRLTVYDDVGDTGFEDVTITVEEQAGPPPNTPPTANAGPNLTVDTGETITISGRGDDSEGAITSWSWERVSGMTIALQFIDTYRVQFTTTDATGTFVLRLTVTDEGGLTDFDEITVTVQEPPPPPPPPPNRIPSANAGPDHSVQQGEHVGLNGSGSDPDGTIVDWFWEQISGPSVTISNANSQNAEFTAPETSGEIRIRLTVTDDDSESDSDEVTITVEEDSGPDNTTGETVFSMLDNINDARGQARKCGDENYPAQPPFQWSSSLADIARIHSMDMARQGYFSHTSADGTRIGERVSAYWSSGFVGENIAASTNNMSDSGVVNVWLDSEGHCKLIMSPHFTHVGIGAGHDSDNGYYLKHFWTLDFGG